MNPSDNIIGLYQRNAAAWAKARAPGGFVFEAPWFDRFAALLPGRTILDIGCGSADPVARYFLNSGFDVTGIDSSPGIIDVCRGKFPNQDWIVADMRTLNLRKAFDGLIAWHSFFHLKPDDQRKMFLIFKNHLRRDGILMFTAGPDAGEVIGEWCGEPLYHGSLSPAEYGARLTESGFDVLGYVLNDPACGHATIWLAKAR